VFNIHVPPHGSGLDTCPRLDTSVTPPRPIAGEKMSAGSTAVRSAIEAYGPLLSLHGHIHESAGITRIGRTTCVNPGSEYEQGVLRTAVVDVMDEGGSVVAQLLEAK
jgi:Icc-related predicted phosphoesterase